MRDRLLQWLKIGSVMLLVVLAARVALILRKSNPLAGVRIPEVPVMQTNAPSVLSTNAAAASTPGRGTNIVSTGSTNEARTNSTSLVSSNSTSATNKTFAGATGNTNSAAPVAAGTNKPVVAASAGSNSVPLPQAVGMPGIPGMQSMPGIGRPMGQGLPARQTNSPVVQARLDRIVQSELFGPIQRPLPMALLGIAGESALIRSPAGPMGFVKVGAELAGVKLLQIGTNRVLVEHEGERKELTIFSGFGGNSLLPKSTDTSAK